MRVKALFLAILINAMGYGIVYPLVAELFAGEEGVHMAAGLSLSLRHFYLGLSFLLFPLASFFSASYLQELALFFGKKWLLVFCMGGLALSFALMGIGVELFSIPLLLIGRTLSGIMAGSQVIAQGLILEKSTVRHPRRYSLMLTVLISTGIVVGPLVGGVFSDSSVVFWLTLSTPFYLAAVLAGVTFFWLMWEVQTPSFEKSHFSLHWLRPINIFLEGFKGSQLRSLSIILLLMQIGFSLFYQLIQVYLATLYQFPSWELGLFNGYLGIAFALVVLFGSKIFIKWWGIQKVASLSLLFTGVFIIFPMLFFYELFLWIMSFLAAGFNMMAYGALIIYFIHAVKEMNQKWAMGVFGTIVTLSWTFTGFSTNFITLIGLRGLIAIGGILILIGCFLMSVNQRHLSSG